MMLTLVAALAAMLPTTSSELEAMDSDEIASIFEVEGPVTGHRIGFRADGTVSSIRLTEAGASVDGRCLRLTHYGTFDRQAQLQRVTTATAAKPGTDCSGSEGWIAMTDASHAQNALRVAKEMEDIQQRDLGAPLAALYCRDDTQQGRCSDPHAALKTVDLDAAWRYEPIGASGGPFHVLSVRDGAIDDTVPSPVWNLSFLPQEGKAQPYLLMRYFQPIPGPPLPPGQPDDVVIGNP